MISSKKFILIDGMNYVYKSYYASLAISKNNFYPNQTIFLFIKQIKSIIDKYKPDYLYIAFDSKETNFRKEIFSEYKAQRPKMPDVLIIQLKKIQILLRFMGIFYSSLPTYEADDLIATMCKKYSTNMKMKIFSSDKDLYQLINENVEVINNKKISNKKVDISYNLKNFRKFLDIDQKQFIDYKCLIGDSSDNLKSIHGLGPKTAINLLKEYKTLNEIILNSNSLKNKKLGDKITSNKEKLLLLKKLIILKDNLNLNISLNDCKIPNKNFDENKFNELCEEWMLKTLIIK